MQLRHIHRGVATRGLQRPPTVALPANPRPWFPVSRHFPANTQEIQWTSGPRLISETGSLTVVHRRHARSDATDACKAVSCHIQVESWKPPSLTRVTKFSNGSGYEKRLLMSVTTAGHHVASDGPFELEGN